MMIRSATIARILAPALCLLAGVASASNFQTVEALAPVNNNASLGHTILSDGSVFGESVSSVSDIGHGSNFPDPTYWGPAGQSPQLINLGNPSNSGFFFDMNDSHTVVGNNGGGFVAEQALASSVIVTPLLPAPITGLQLTETRAQSINNSGVIVGSSFLLDLNGNEAASIGTVWRKDGNHYIPEATFPVEEILGISDNGNVVGWLPRPGGNTTWIRNVMGNPIQFSGDIGGLNGPGVIFGVDINNSAQTVGWANNNDPSAGLATTAFFWDPILGMTGIDNGALGAVESFGTAVNNDGLMVGSLNMIRVPGEAPYHAFCYYNGKAVDLNTLIDPSSGWVLYRAEDVNDDGWITGVGTLNGQFMGFRMQHRIVPEPTSAVLIVVGTGLVLSTRRRST